MKLEEIKKAVDAGKTVHWYSNAYRVIKTGAGYQIVCDANDHAIGLVHQDDQTMNGYEQHFYLAQ